jgi:hypothetical protein
MNTENICIANILVTTVLLQKKYVAALHMARVPHGPVHVDHDLSHPTGSMWEQGRRSSEDLLLPCATVALWALNLKVSQRFSKICIAI